MSESYTFVFQKGEKMDDLIEPDFDSEEMPNPEFDEWAVEQGRLEERDEDPGRKHIPCTEEEEQQFDEGMLGI